MTQAKTGQAYPLASLRRKRRGYRVNCQAAEAKRVCAYPLASLRRKLAGYGVFCQKAKPKSRSAYPLASSEFFQQENDMGMNLIPALFLAAFIVVLYFAPAIVAHQRKHPNFGAITATNVLLGWTALGWIVAMIWSFTAIKTPAVVAATVSE